MTRTEILQTAKSILFNTEMVRAIQDGRKTATRRPIKVYTAFPKALKPVENPVGLMTAGGIIRPQYKVGDYLYVRETWGISTMDYDDKMIGIIYKASQNEKECGYRNVKFPNDKFEKLYNSMAESSPDWRPSIHMPKEAARIFLRVTGIIVQRVNEITEEQAIAEGFASRAEFISEFLKIYPSCTEDSWVWVIEFERVEVFK